MARFHQLFRSDGLGGLDEQSEQVEMDGDGNETHCGHLFGAVSGGVWKMKDGGIR